jgi:dethiobiotin synthetase
MSVLVITGTGTEVGKTIVTATLAATANGAGLRVAVVKLAQTGIAAGDEADVDVVTRLSGVTDVHELARYPEPLAPATAARRAGIAALPVAAMVGRVRALSDRDVVLAEGAGGVLVRLDDDGHTVVDVAAALDAAVVVVAAAGLGTLNATALTCEALRARGVRCAGVVIGSWPVAPDLAAQTNLEDLPSYAGVPLLGVLPEGSGGLDPTAFRAMAASQLDAATLSGVLGHCR